MDNSHPAGAQAQLQIRVISTDSFQITSVRWRHPDRFQAAPDLRPHRAPPAVIERRLLQHLQPPQLRQPGQLPQLSAVRAGDADAEQLSGKRRPERRPQSSVPDWRSAVDPTRAQAAVLDIGQDGVRSAAGSLAHGTSRPTWKPARCRRPAVWPWLSIDTGMVAILDNCQDLHATRLLRHQTPAASHSGAVRSHPAFWALTCIYSESRTLELTLRNGSCRDASRSVAESDRFCRRCVK